MQRTSSFTVNTLADDNGNLFAQARTDAPLPLEHRPFGEADW